MNYKKFITNTKKYHYFVNIKNKIILLASSNSKTDAKNLALSKFQKNIESNIGKNLIYIKVRRYKEYKENPSELSFINGPIALEFENGHIVDGNTIKNIKLSNTDHIFLSDKYIRNHENNLLEDYKKIIQFYLNKKLNKSVIDVLVL